jgi:hypothetical protein
MAIRLTWCDHGEYSDLRTDRSDLNPAVAHIGGDANDVFSRLDLGDSLKREDSAVLGAKILLDVPFTP